MSKMEGLKKLLEERTKESVERASELEEKFNKKLKEFEKIISKRIDKCTSDMEKRLEECCKNLAETKIETNKKIEQENIVFKEDLFSLKTEINAVVTSLSEQIGDIKGKTDDSPNDEVHALKQQLLVDKISNDQNIQSIVTRVNTYDVELNDVRGENKRIEIEMRDKLSKIHEEWLEYKQYTMINNIPSDNEYTIPKFFGDKRSDYHPKEYLCELEQYFQIKRVSPMNQMLIVANKGLKGEAAAWYASIKYKNVNFEEFSKLFLAEYWSEEIQLQVWGNLSRSDIQVPDNIKYRDYATDIFKKIRFLDCPKLSEETAIIRIANHFPRYISGLLLSMPVKTFDLVREILTREDKYRSENTSKPYQYYETANNNRNYRQQQQQQQREGEIGEREYSNNTNRSYQGENARGRNYNNYRSGRYNGNRTYPSQQREFNQENQGTSHNTIQQIGIDNCNMEGEDNDARSQTNDLRPSCSKNE